MNVVTAAAMRDIEARAARLGVSSGDLMERAGRAAAECAARMLGGPRYQRIVVLAGPGNNGGDGLVAARYLHDAGAWVRCVLPVPRDEADPNLIALRERDIPLLPHDAPGAVDNADLVIDALLGTGRARAIEGPLAFLLDRLRAIRTPGRRPSLLALDLPTGVNADTGAADPHTVAADRTITFGYSKVGLHAWPGSDLAGEVEVADIGLPPGAEGDLLHSLITPDWVRSALPPRLRDANKGTFGRVMVVAGSQRYPGAAALAAEAALRIGAGLVTLAATEGVCRVMTASLREATYLPLPERDGTLCRAAADALLPALAGYDALLIGPGVAQTPDTAEFVNAVLEGVRPDSVRAVVIDADALNTLAKSPGWHERVRAPCVLTPHPGEMARLRGVTVAEVQANRLDMALDAARSWGHVVVLKGANTLVAAPDGHVRISTVATPALATAGTGDVLAGAIASFIGQGMAPFPAAAAAVWAHGQAGLRLAEARGARGALAGDVLAEMPSVFATLERDGEL